MLTESSSISYIYFSFVPLLESFYLWYIYVISQSLMHRYERKKMTNVPFAETYLFRETNHAFMNMNR